MGDVSDLVQLPEPVIKKILGYLPNQWNVSFTCKKLYKIVCLLEQNKFVLKLEGIVEREKLLLINDSTFKSIMNTSRLFDEINFSLDPAKCFFTPLEVHDRQIERLLEITKKFGDSIASMTWTCLDFRMGNTFQLLQLVPKLRSLTFCLGRISGPRSECILKLPELQHVSIVMVPGFLTILNSLSENSIVECAVQTQDETSESLRKFLQKQRNLKSLKCWYPIDSMLINRLALEILCLYKFDVDRLTNTLKCQPNLTRLLLDEPICGNTFKWICKNLSHLKILEVQVPVRFKTHLKNLRLLHHLERFSTIVSDISVIYEAESNSVRSLKVTGDTLKNFSSTYSPDFNIIVQNFPNLDILEIPVDSIRQFWVMLSYYPRLEKVRSWIAKPNRYKFRAKIFPTISVVAVQTDSTSTGDMIYMVDVVKAMPNLHFLSVKITMKYDSNLLRQLIDTMTNLKHLEVATFVFYDTFVVNKTFVEMIKKLDDQLKTYSISFKTTKGRSYAETLRLLLSRELDSRYIKICSDTLKLNKGQQCAYKISNI